MNKKTIETIIDNVRPALQADGGDLELVEITDDGIVKVRLQGQCRGCPMSGITLKNMIEREIKKEVPEVREVVAV